MLLYTLMMMFTATFAVQWTSTSTFPNGTVVQVCAGDNLTLPWAFNATPTSLTLIEWLMVPKDQQEITLANYSRGRFNNFRSAERLMEFKPNAGLFLPEATTSDSGYYKVVVDLHEESQMYLQSASVEVYEAPITIDGGLHAYILPDSFYQETTGYWHIQLGCGNFLFLGQPASSVTWHTPSGMTMDSSSCVNGTFILTLPNPVEEGVYSCSLEVTPLTIKCLHNHSSLYHDASVHVSGVHTRLSLLEGGFIALREETIKLFNPISDLKDLAKQLEISDDVMKGEIKYLSYKTDNITGNMYQVDNVIKNLSDALNNIRNANNIITEMVEDLQAQNDHFAGEVDKLRNVDVNVAVIMYELQTDLAHFTDGIETLQNSMHNITSQNNQLRNEVTILNDTSRNILDLILTHNEHFKDEVKVLREEIRTMTDTMQKQNKHLADEIKALHTANKNITDTMQRQDKHLGDEIKALHTVKINITDTMQRHNKHLGDEIKALHTLNRNFTDTMQRHNKQFGDEIKALHREGINIAEAVHIETKQRQQEVKNLQELNKNITNILQDHQSKIESQILTTNRLQKSFGNINDTMLECKSHTQQIAGIVRKHAVDETNLAALVSALQYDVNYLKGQTNKLLQRSTSCDDVMEYDRESGIHTLFLGDNRNVRVYCDQTTGDGGWVVIQRRQNGFVDFYRNWSQYVAGFGSLSTEFWIGLDNLYHLTKTQNYKLRVDLMDFDGSRAYAEYDNFRISSSSDNYRLYVEGYSGTAGDSLSNHHLMQFTTYDSDNDEGKYGDNCAIAWHGAWWYKLCHTSNLNGRYKFDGAEGADGVTWFHWKNDYRSMKRVEMKIKRKGS